METESSLTPLSNPLANLTLEQAQALRVDLKRLLMELGNRLVTEHGYTPASVSTEETEADVQEVFRDETTLLYYLACWLNDPKAPERREVLDSLQVDWPVSEIEP